MKRWILFGAIGLAVLFGLSLLLSPSGRPVDVATATRRPIRTFVEERGKTRLPRIYSITMPFEGRIEEIEYLEGSPVLQGQVVAQIEKVDLRTQVAEARARVEALTARIEENDDERLERSALDQVDRFLESTDRTVESAEETTKSSLARAEFNDRELERQRKLRKQKAASEFEFNQAQLDAVEATVDHRKDVLLLRALEAGRDGFRIGRRAIEQYIEKKSLKRAVHEKEKDEAEAQLEQALRDLARCDLKSPVDGIVLKRHVENERVLPAGELLLELGRIEDLEVEAEVLSQEAVTISPGDQVDLFGPALGEGAIAGRVARIYPQGFMKVSSLGVEQQRVLVIVEFAEGEFERLEEQGRKLGVDYRVKARIYTAGKEDALVVPRSALFRGRDGGWRVYVVRDGKAVLADVSVGLSNDEEAEILDGIAPEEQVILAPESDLSDGIAVDPHELETLNQE
ncbi:HlyD family efflux transporter periplasmic adaptor subunit [Planctomycetes bacterium Pan216]